MFDTLHFLAEEDRALMSRGQAIAASLVDTVRGARAYWGAWEAINERLFEGAPLSKALKWSTPSGLGALRGALAQATVLAVLRMTEHPKKGDSHSACCLSGLLSNEKVQEILISESWIRRDHPRLDDWIVTSEIEAQPERIAWFQERVPFGWGPKVFTPERDDLAKARSALRGIRDRRIAHSVFGDFDAPKVDDIRRGLCISIDIAAKASLMFLGSDGGLTSALSDDVKRYGDVWEFFEDGLVAKHFDWLKRKTELSR